MFPPSALALPGEVLLITDELSSPADFLLHRSLSSHLRERQGGRSVILSVSGDLAQWKAIASKSNLHLAQCIAARSLIFFDVKSDIMDSDSYALRPGPSLRSLLNRLRAALNDLHASPSLVILDDIASLEWIGVPVLELSRFIRALCELCRKTHAALILRHHVVTPGQPDDLLRHLLQLCTYHMDVLPLSSGKSGAVSGQVALHSGPGVVDAPFRLVARSAAVHYRLTDTGAVFFGRGTGGGVL